MADSWVTIYSVFYWGYGFTEGYGSTEDYGYYGKGGYGSTEDYGYYGKGGYGSTEDYGYYGKGGYGSTEDYGYYGKGGYGSTEDYGYYGKGGYGSTEDYGYYGKGGYGSTEDYGYYGKGGYGSTEDYGYYGKGGYGSTEDYGYYGKGGYGSTEDYGYYGKGGYGSTEDYGYYGKGGYGSTEDYGYYGKGGYGSTEDYGYYGKEDTDLRMITDITDAILMLTKVYLKIIIYFMKRRGGDMSLLRLIFLIAETSFIVGLFIQSIGLSRRDKKIVKIGFGMTSMSCIFFFCMFMLLGDLEMKLVGIGALAIMFVNGIIIQKKLNEITVILKIKGTVENLKTYFKTEIEQGIFKPEDLEQKDMVTGSMFVKIKLPDFNVTPELVLILSPADKDDFWRLQLITDFGVTEKDVKGFLEQMKLWQDLEKVYYHRDFAQGKLIHLFDFSPSNWRLAG